MEAGRRPQTRGSHTKIHKRVKFLAKKNSQTWRFNITMYAPVEIAARVPNGLETSMGRPSRW